MPNITISTAFADARRKLQAAGFTTADLDAGILLQHACGANTMTRISHPEIKMTQNEKNIYDTYINRRLAREPVHRITREREFYGLVLGINDATLIPRPDTEILIDMVMPYIHETITKYDQCNVLDLGTGTGAIALAILKQTPKVVVTATDIEPKALAMAEKNAIRHNVKERLTLIQSDWFENVSGLYDLIISNPPYIPSKAIVNLDIDVRDYDPIRALDGGPNGIDAYYIIAEQCSQYLKEKGRIAIEIGFDQKKQVSCLFERNNFVTIETQRDLNNQNRALFLTQ